MILDAQALFSDQQAITANAASTNYMDFSVAADQGKGVPMPLLIQVTEDFDNLTDLTVDLEVDNDEAFGSVKKVSSVTVALADLKAGKQIPPMYMPQGVDERYCRLYYTVNGAAPTAGKITAGVTCAVQTNR